MATCGDFEYDLIEYRNLFDLDRARLVRAQIASIDRVANTAEITLFEECPELAGKTLTDVPFFYHCETSTGTVEDLAKGNKAFLDDDMVYVLFVPANGDDVPERFYIIGHVDIRLTVRCEAVEYVRITYGSWVTIFDTSTGGTLDLANFTNKDESPAKPSAIPCEVSTSFNEWFAFNFRASVPAANMPFTVTGYNKSTSSYTETNDYDNTGLTSAYLIKRTYKDALGALINSTYSLESFDGSRSSISFPSSYHFVNHYENTKGLDTTGIIISDSVALEDITIAYDILERSSTELTYGGSSGTPFYITKTETINVYRYNGDTLIDSLEAELNGGVSGAIENWLLQGEDTEPWDYTASRFGKALRDKASRVHFSYAVGEDGVYSIRPFLYALRINRYSKDIACELYNDIGSSSPSMFGWWASVTLAPDRVGYYADMECQAEISPSGKVTMFWESEIDTSSNLSIIGHFNNANTAMSSGLDATVTELVNALYGGLPTATVSSPSFNVNSLVSYNFTMAAYKKVNNDA